MQCGNGAITENRPYGKGNESAFGGWVSDRDSWDFLIVVRNLRERRLDVMYRDLFLDTNVEMAGERAYGVSRLWRGTMREK